MVTDTVSFDRGFDFATEEHGVEMRCVQTNLSEQGIKVTTGIRRLRSRGKNENSSVLLNGFMKRRVQSSFVISE